MSRLNLRKKTRVSYFEPDEPPLDDYIFCTNCRDYVYEYCSIHGPMLVVPDNKVPAVTNYPSYVPRAALTIPEEFLHIARSAIPGAGLGVFSTLTLPAGVRFGPYRGVLTDELESSYCWQLYDGERRPRGVVDAADANNSNWMRYVNCSRCWQEQNLLAFQYQGQLYYRTLRIIPRFTELLVFYGSEFANNLGIDLSRYNAPRGYAQKLGSPLEVKTNADKEKNNAQETSNTARNSKIPIESLESTKAKAHPSYETSTTINITSNTKPIAESLKPLQDSKAINLISESYLYHCDHCNRKFASKDILRQHIDKHIIVNLNFKCNVCNFRCHTATLLEQHAQSHTNTGNSARKRDKKKSLLKVCDKTIISTTLKRHTSADESLNTHSGDTCVKRVTENLDLNRQKRTHPSEKPYLCLVCVMRFTRNDHLKTHMRTHTGEKPYQCTVCDKRFTQSSNLKYHIRTHTVEKPHQCTVCDKRFIQSRNLKDHIRTHTGEKPHQCTACDKRFTKSSNLKDHIRTHTGEKPHQCTVCDKRFIQGHHLKCHMRTHTGEKPYQCTVCDKRFKHSCVLKTHNCEHTLVKSHISVHNGESDSTKLLI